MINTNNLFIILFSASVIVCQEPACKEPWFTARIINDSKNIFLVSGFIDTQGHLSDILNPGRNIAFTVSVNNDDLNNKAVMIPTNSGIYSISLHCFFDKDDRPLNTCAVFEKFHAGAAGNKIAAISAFRNYLPIKAFGQELQFRLYGNTLLCLQPPDAFIDQEIAFQRPAEAFVPPFTS